MQLFVLYGADSAHARDTTLVSLRKHRALRAGLAGEDALAGLVVGIGDLAWKWDATHGHFQLREQFIHRRVLGQ